MFYPPGIPILAPGDEIEPEALYYIRTMQRLGLKVVGPADSTLQTIQVVRDNR
jgi:arginine/lysine/ornithine decarboxylase